MKQDSEWEVLPPVSAPRAAAPQSEWEALPPTAPRRSAGGRQPAPARPRGAPVVRDESEYSGALTREDSVRAFMDQGYPADVALQKAIEQEQYDDAATAAAAGGQRADPASGAITVEELPAGPNSPLENLILGRPQQREGNLLEQARDAALRVPGVGQFLSYQAGVGRGANRVLGGAYGLVGQAADRIGLDGIGNAMIDQANAYQNFMDTQNAPYREANTGFNQTGQFAGEVAATAPVAGVVGRGIAAGGQAVARVAPRAGQILERVGQATQAGGFLPSAVRAPAAGAAPALAERAGNLAVRAAGGAISGGTQAALINEEDAAAGATIGALLPTIAARPAKWALNRLLTGFEALTGSLGRSRASEIVRQSLGVDYDTALAALRNAGPDVTAQQALVEAGVEPAAFMGIGAGVRAVEPDAFLGIEAAQRAARQGSIDRLAGGANLTDAQLAQRAEKAALRDATVPMQQAELAAADASGTLDVAPVSAALMQQADAPGVGTTNSRVLAEIASALDTLAARRGGVASAEDIYALRMNDLDDIISRALSGQRGGDISGQAARRSQLVRETQQMLDDAIEAAGGSGWRQYLETYASGMRGVERQNMMGVAGRQLRNSPNAFANLVEGDAPEVVSGVFGGNRIDLRNLMNPTGVGPSGMDALESAARQVRRDERVGVLATEGAGRARELLAPGRSPFRRARNIMTMGRPVTAAAMEFGSMLVDAKVSPQIRRELARAYQSGENMDQLLQRVPLATRAQVQRNLMNPAFWAHLQGGAVNAMTGNGGQPNTMSPAPQ